MRELFESEMAGLTDGWDVESRTGESEMTWHRRSTGAPEETREKAERRQRN